MFFVLVFVLTILTIYGQKMHKALGLDYVALGG
jgi:hypothetical protein